MIKPFRPYFGSGPTVKPLGWNTHILKNALVSRSHRSTDGIAAIEEVTKLTREVLEIPSSHHIALVPGSATGAMQMAMWNLLGTRPVHVLATDVFGHRWRQDVHDNLSHISCIEQCVPEGSPFELDDVSWNHDVLFLWNASTAGTRLPDSEWISKDRQGLSICDATSAVYCMPLPWEKLDATAFSWQKGLGGEAGFGVLVLGPRAFERLERFPASQAVPFVLNLRRQGKPVEELFQAKPLNTLSMLCLEDARWCHKWAVQQGGLQALIKRSQLNLKSVQDWILENPDFTFIAKEPNITSSSTICFRMRADFLHVWPTYKAIAQRLAQENLAFDCLNHTGSAASFRLWGGPTMEADDLKALLPYLKLMLKDIR